MSLKKLDNYRICLNEILGVNGNTYMGFNHTSKQQVVIKAIPKNQILIRYDNNIQTFKQQVRFLHKIRKNVSYVVRYLNLLETSNNFYIILEYCKSGNLKKLISQKKLTYAQAFKYIRHILKGFAELSKKGILHGNLAPQNILFHNGLMRLADFGIRTKRQIQNILLNIKNTTYLAPEVFEGKPYTYKSDIWSLGVVFYEILYRSVPWKTGRLVNIYLQRIMNQPLQFPHGPEIPEQLKNLIKQCLEKEPSERCQWEEIFSNPIFNGEFSQTMSTDIHLGYILGQLRSSLFNSNLDLERYFQGQNIKEDSMLSYDKLSKMLHCIDPNIDQKEVKYLFDFFDNNHKTKQIQFTEFRNALEHFEINLKFQSLRRKHKKKSSEIQFQSKLLLKDQLFQVAVEKIITQIKIHKIYDLYDFFIKNDKSIQMNFKQDQNDSIFLDQNKINQLLRKIEPKLNDDQCKVIYRKININNQEKITFQDFMKGICALTGSPYNVLTIQKILNAY